MENDNKINILSVEKFNKITKKELYEIYFNNCSRINSQINFMNDYKAKIIEQGNIINNQIDYINNQKDELKICRIIIWVLLIIIFLLSITLVVF